MNIYENGYQCGRGGYGRNPYDARRERQKYNAWQDGYAKGRRISVHDTPQIGPWLKFGKPKETQKLAKNSC